MEREKRLSRADKRKKYDTILRWLNAKDKLKRIALAKELNGIRIKYFNGDVD